MALVLYDYELSADAYKVRLFLALLGISYTKRLVDAHPGNETQSAEFLALNPRGTLPVLVDDGLTLAGAEAILCHLAATRGAGRNWLPHDPAAFAACMSWLFYAAQELRAAETARLEAMLGVPSPIADARAKARAALRVLDDHLVLQALHGLPFLVGTHPTIADVALFAPAALAIDFGCALEEFPKLRAWTRRIRALPGFIAMPGIPEFL
jgi:glutathione S-transferase